MNRLNDKVAIVTGASRGIGAAIARRLAMDGAKVVVNFAQSERAAGQVVAAIESAGGEAVAIKADLSDTAQIALLFDAAMKKFGRLDILVNNAAMAEPAPLASSGIEHYARHFDLNVRGVLLATAEAAKHMTAGGRIINISSGVVRQRAGGYGVYAATKAAVEAFTRCHAAELGKRGITVNSVAPGVTDTDMLRSAMPEAMQKDLIAQTPLGRLGKPDDIADAVALIASDDARWITGEIIPASGGLG
jgi:3-oxoacyl-[acyl-carrier protein] reductase